MALAEERQQVVLAEAVEVDVLDDDHLAILDREQRVVQHLVDVSVIPAGEELQGFLDPRRRVHQPLAIGIFPERRQKVPYEILHPSIVYPAHGDPSGGAVG